MTPEPFIEVSRDGQNLGRFSLAVARQNLRAGILKPNDWAWHEGLTDWVPLNSVLGQSPVESARETGRSKRAHRKGYSIGILCIAALVVGVIFIKSLANRPRQISATQESVRPSTVTFQDPFASNAIVYAYSPPGQILGDNLTTVVCSESYDEVYALMLKESDTNYKIAVSLGNQLFKKDYLPESKYKEEFAQYILDKQREKKLLLMPLHFKMQIIQKKLEDDATAQSIFECRALEPASEGMVLYIQLKYLTKRSEK